MKIPKSLPHELRRLREEAGLTQRALERRADLSKRRLSHLEPGERVPSGHELRRICQALGVSFEALVEATRWEERPYGRPPEGPAPAIRAAFGVSEPFAWTGGVSFEACFNAAFRDFSTTARALQARIDLRDDLKAVEHFCRDLTCGAKGEALFDLHLLARRWSPVVLSPLELGFADPRVRDYRVRPDRPYVGHRPMSGFAWSAEDFAAAVLAHVPIDAERPALLDYLVFVRCGPMIARGDLEIDDPSHDAEKDESRRKRLGLDTLRIRDADLDDHTFPLIQVLKEWCLGNGRTRQRQLAPRAPLQRPLPHEGQNRNASASQAPQPAQAEPDVCERPQPGQKPMSNPTR